MFFEGKNIFAFLSVNFTNILRAPFSYESFARRFFVLAVKVNFLFAQEYWRNCANKMMVKLTPDLFVRKEATEKSNRLLIQRISFGRKKIPNIILLSVMTAKGSFLLQYIVYIMASLNGNFRRFCKEDSLCINTKIKSSNMNRFFQRTLCTY